MKKRKISLFAVVTVLCLLASTAFGACSDNSEDGSEEDKKIESEGGPEEDKKTESEGGSGNEGEELKKEIGESYELCRFEAGSNASNFVIFELQNPSYVDKNGRTVTDYYRLTNVYLHVGSMDNGESESAEITLARGAAPAPNAFPYNATLGNVAYQPENEEDKTVLNAVGNWIEPFDFSVTNPVYLSVAIYKYYRIQTGTCNLFIDEIVFYGEKLTSAAGEGTGEYGVIPVKIYSAPCKDGESVEQARERANALIDVQQKPEIK